MVVQRRSGFPPVLEWDEPDLATYFASQRPEWMARGACRTTSVDMFPDDGAGVFEAMAVCAECPVKGRCLDFALEHREQHGVWGGKSQRQRARMRSGRVSTP